MISWHLDFHGHGSWFLYKRELTFVWTYTWGRFLHKPKAMTVVRALSSHPKVVSLTWSTGIYVRVASWRWDWCNFCQIMKHLFKICHLGIHVGLSSMINIFEPLRPLPSSVKVNLMNGLKPFFLPMRDLRTQLSLAFNLVCEMALSVESEPDANFDRSWNI